MFYYTTKWTFFSSSPYHTDFIYIFKFRNPENLSKRESIRYLKQNSGEDGFDDRRKRYSLTPPAAPSWRRFWYTADKAHRGPVWRRSGRSANGVRDERWKRFVMKGRLNIFGNGFNFDYPLGNPWGLFHGRIVHAGKIVFASEDSFKTLSHPRNPR